MNKTYRVGVASLVHDHVWNELKKWSALPNVEIVAAGDVNQDLRDKIKTEWDVQRVYNSWQEMVAKEDGLDIVQATSENSACAHIVDACTAKGFNVISEK